MKQLALFFLIISFGLYSIGLAQETISDEANEEDEIKETSNSSEEEGLEQENNSTEIKTEESPITEDAVLPTEKKKMDPITKERIIVASVAGGIAVAGLATGLVFGIQAQKQFNCLKDINECNKNLEDKIEGTEYLDARAEVERKALYADMGYLISGNAVIVAIVGLIELLTGKEEVEVTE